jgi:hypothetical protein
MVAVTDSASDKRFGLSDTDQSGAEENATVDREVEASSAIIASTYGTSFIGLNIGSFRISWFLRERTPSHK